MDEAVQGGSDFRLIAKEEGEGSNKIKKEDITSEEPEDTFKKSVEGSKLMYLMTLITYIENGSVCVPTDEGESFR